MQQLNLLSNTEVLTLFYNIQDIIAFQRDLLGQIDQVLYRNADYRNYTSQGQFSALLCELASVFLTNAERFKLYCTFCANHSKAMKTLYTDCNSNAKLIEFLTTSCKGEHASSLESYLIKPIQRILKYPLLIQQICSSSQPESKERERLACALDAMENVAYKLNEMQRIHEEYGAIFEHLQRQHLKATKQSVHLSTSELNHHGEVQWQNVQDVLGKMKKNLDLYTVCFVFKSAVVFLCKEKIKQKKKLVVSVCVLCVRSVCFLFRQSKRLRCGNRGIAKFIGLHLKINNHSSSFSLSSPHTHADQLEQGERSGDHQIPGADAGERGASAIDHDQEHVKR